MLNLRSKEQEAELVRQTLAVLSVMRIRFPGKTEEEAEAVLDEVGHYLCVCVCVCLCVCALRYSNSRHSVCIACAYARLPLPGHQALS